MLAYHFERGEVWEKAVEYLLQVAEKAKTRYASSSAVISGMLRTSGNSRERRGDFTF